MTTVKSDIKINAPKNEVWDIIADLGAISDYHPFATQSRYITQEKEGLGAARYCYVLPDIEVNETVSNWVSGQTIAVDLDFLGGQVPPVKNVNNTLTLSSAEDGDSEVEMVMTFDFDGDSQMEEEIKKQFKTLMDGANRGLKHYAETGELVDFNLLSKLEPVS